MDNAVEAGKHKRAFTAIVNPIAGGGRADALWEPLSDQLRHAGFRVETVHSRSAEHAIDAAFDAAAHSVVVAVGGDGLVRDVATGVVRAEGTMAIVPAGRGNDLVRVLHIPTAPDELVAYLTSAPERRIDVLEVGDRFVPGNVYAGIDGRATRIINANRWLHPRLLYRVAPFVAAIGWRPFLLTSEMALDGAPPRSQRAHGHCCEFGTLRKRSRYGSNGLARRRIFRCFHHQGSFGPSPRQNQCASENRRAYDAARRVGLARNRRDAQRRPRPPPLRRWRPHW